jgi:hypothetical protein
MKITQNYLIKGNKLNYNGCRIQNKLMEAIRANVRCKLTDTSGEEEENLWKTNLISWTQTVRTKQST